MEEKINQSNQSENQKFLEELGIRSDAGVEPSAWKGPEENSAQEGTTAPEKEELPAEDNLKNRRERRLMAKMQAEREANIALQARLQALSEAQKLREETTEADFLKLVEPIYGSADEKGQYDPRRVEATKLLKDALRGAYTAAKKEAVEEALAKLNEAREAETAAEREEDENLDEGMDAVEEKYGIDLGSKKNRDKYLTHLEEASPKDEEGNITEFAFDAAARIYQLEEGKTNSRAKELAARSGTRSGSSQPSELQDQAFYNNLKALGLMD